MRSFAELNEFIDKHVFTKERSIELQRLSLRHQMRWLWATCLVPFAIFTILLIRRWTSGEEEQVTDDLPIFWKMFSVVATIIVFVLLCSVARSFIRRRLEEEEVLDQLEDDSGRIVKTVVGFLHSAYTYQPWNHIMAADFFNGNLFRKGSYAISGRDMIYGRKGEARFSISSLTVVDENKGQTVFNGNYFIAQFPASFHSPVFLSSRFRDSGYINILQWGRKILLNNKAFNGLFATHTHESILAVDLLTPALMQLLLVMQQKTESGFYIAFTGNQLHVAIDSKSGYFKGLDEGGVKSRQLLFDFYSEFQELLKMISLLSNNTDIWNRSSINE